MLRASAPIAPSDTDHPTEHARRAELLHGREEPDAERRAGNARQREDGHEDPDLGRQRRSVPEHERHETHPEVSDRQQCDRSEAIGEPGDQQRADDRADRHAAPDQADLDPATVQGAHHERHEEHDEEALGDLAESVDQHERADHRLAPDGTKPGAHTTIHLLPAVTVGRDRARVGADERHRHRDREERDTVDGDHGFDAAEADRDATER